MAAPTATGLISDFLDKKRITLGQKEIELCSHPEFTLEKSIEDVYKLALQKNLSGSIMLHMLIDGIKKWTPDDDVKKVNTAIKDLLPSKKKVATSTIAVGLKFFK